MTYSPYISAMYMPKCAIAVLLGLAVAHASPIGGVNSTDTAPTVPAIPIGSLHPSASNDVWDEADRAKLSVCRCDLLENLRRIIDTRENCHDFAREMQDALAKVEKYFGPAEEREFMYQRYE